MMGRDDSPGPRARTALAHAKVNLFLAVGARRPDGFHDVTTVLQAVGLADEIEVLPAGEGTVVERDVDLGIADIDDLVYRAAEAWRSLSGFAGGITIRVKKRIPAAGGLGGGSANAAAVLAALCTWTGADPESDAGMLEAARTLGADVPFFLGAGTSLLTGRGDEPVRDFRCPPLQIVLVNPGVAVPTGAAYAQFDRLLMPPPPGPEAMVAALVAERPHEIASALFNNMTEASCALVPEIGEALRSLGNAEGSLGALMAGSGSTVFALFGSEADAAAAAAAALERGWWSTATSAVSRAVEVA